MNYENVKFSSEAREKIIQGVNLIVDAIQVSYGPNGHQVAIMTNDTVKVTKDGATIATAVNHQDPYVQIGINLIREISRKTAEDVGDGSSTVTILAREIIKQFQDVNDPITTFRELQSYVSEILEWLDSKKTTITFKEDLLKVATLSANNDEQIGSIIAEAYDKVGVDGMVTFEESEEVADRVEYTEGFRIESGYSSPYFINTVWGSCELENVYVHVSETKMEEVKEVVALADKAMEQNKSLLLIAPAFESEIYLFLKANLDLLKSCTVIAPNYRNYRQIMLDDIKDIIGDSKTCQKIICTSKTTTFIGYESNLDKIQTKLQFIQDTINEDAVTPFDLEFAKKRRANFTSGIATIKVGGWTQTEISSKLDLYEDAVNSTHQALMGGILPGGGVAIRDVTKNFVIKECISPFFNVLTKPSELLGTTDDTWESMLDKGIIEPFNTCKTTLENAVSIAGQILSCNCAIINNIKF